MYLIDTNIFLELLLEQEKAEEVREFFLKVPSSDISISEFTFYSIGVALLRLRRFTLLLKWVSEITESEIQIIRLNPEYMPMLIENAKNFNLDFDDAYQYTVSSIYNLQLPSFNSIHYSK